MRPKSILLLWLLSGCQEPLTFVVQENSMQKDNIWIACPSCTSRISILRLHFVDSESIELWWTSRRTQKPIYKFVWIRPSNSLFDWLALDSVAVTHRVICALSQQKLQDAVDAWNRPATGESLHKLVSWKGYQVDPQCIFKIFTCAQSIAPAHSKEKGCRFTRWTPSPPTALKCNKNIVKSGLLTNPGPYGNSELKTLRTNLDTNPKSQWNAQRLKSDWSRAFSTSIGPTLL